MSEWLVTLAWISLAGGGCCAVVIAIDELRHPQHMWIMNVVWPVTALYGSVVALWTYFRFGRLSTKAAVMAARINEEENPGTKKPFPAITAVAATHCGSGCTLGDIVAEWCVVFFPVLLTWLGYKSLFEKQIFATWILDFFIAYLFGIVFQYFTIVPMRKLSPLRGLWAAIKADTLSLVAWQLGMYGWMAITVFAIFHHELQKTSPVFWFMMQIAMLCGFATSYPVNWWLVKRGLKEKM